MKLADATLYGWLALIGVVAVVVLTHEWRNRPRGRQLRGKGWVAGSGEVPSSPPPPKRFRLGGEVPPGDLVSVVGPVVPVGRYEALTMAAKLRQVAVWLDHYDDLRGDPEHEAQTDIRLWADRLEATGRLP